jgi:subtilisin family serine protease
MRKKIIGIFVCMLLIASVVLPVAGTVSKKVHLFNNVFENQPDMKFVPGEIIVKLKNDTTFSRYSLASLNRIYQVNAFEKVFPNAEGTILDNIYLVHIPVESDILSILQDYYVSSDVVYAEPNWIGDVCGIPNDTNFSSLWYLHNTGQKIWLQLQLKKFTLRVSFNGIPDADIDAPEAWNITTGSPDVVIAIIDSGIDYTHPDLAANIWTNLDEIPDNGIDDDQNGYVDDVRGWNTCYNNSNITDGFGHGTLCAGIAGAVGNNGLFGAGIAWNCKLMPVRILDENGSGAYLIEVVKGIQYAVNNGADIISMSWSFRYRSSILKDAVDYAYGKGVVLCASAGNEYSSIKRYPAALDNVIAVGATDWDDLRCYFSNYGQWVDIAAPGEGIFSTMPTYHVVMNDPPNYMTENFGWAAGTSCSCPMVASVAALLLSKTPSLTPDEVKALLCENVDPYSGLYIGTGRLNACKALSALP